MANRKFILPHNNKSGTNKDSNIFMVNTITNCNTTFNLDLYPDTIQIAIIISEKPMSMVISLECS